MHFLIFSSFQKVIKNLEIFFKVNDRIFIRKRVINTQSSSYVQYFYGHAVFLEPDLPLVDFQTQMLEYAEIGNLGTNVEMQSHKTEVFGFFQYFNSFRQIVGGNPELILIQPRRDVFMCFGIYI